MQKEATCLSFIIIGDGIIADPEKVKVMRQMLPPTCVTKISFIGVCSHHRRFIPNFSVIEKAPIR